MSKARCASRSAEALDRLRGADEPGRCSGAPTSALPVFSSISRSAAEPANRADFREDIGLGPVRPLVGDDFENLRDDVARALHHHRVADRTPEPRDLVLVVQRGVGDDDRRRR